MLSGIGSLIRSTILLSRQWRPLVSFTMGQHSSKSSGSNPKSQGGSSQPESAEAKMAAQDTVSAVVCGVDDLKDGEMKEVEVGEGKALLVKDKGTFYAVGHKCTHYGAPLAKGAFANGCVRCPWHGACFNVKTGDIEDFPGLDSIPKFDVTIKDGKVSVSGSQASFANAKRVKNMCPRDKSNQDVYLIVGGGPASVEAAETLRQEGFTGKVVIATKEAHLPYDRPKLSKAMTVKPEEIALRKSDFYEQHGIEVLTGMEATSVSVQDNSVKFSGGQTISYTKLLLATGAVPRSIPVPGVDLQNVCMLRAPEDAAFIVEQGKEKNVVIIGGSFIGMEVAAFLAGKAASVSVIDIVSVPFQLALGDIVGAALGKMVEAKGVKFYGSSGVKEISGGGGKVTGVVTKDGTTLPADLVVLGTGVGAATKFLQDSGIQMNKFGQVSVDKYMKTNIENVFAAGDIVEFPLFTVGDQKVNIGHWQLAHAHGRCAALNMVKKQTELRSVPFFWTMMFGKSLRYTGYGPGYDDVVVHGNTDELKFVAYYTKGDVVVAAASMGLDPIVSEVAGLLAAGKTISKADIKDNMRGWQK